MICSRGIGRAGNGACAGFAGRRHRSTRRRPPARRCGGHTLVVAHAPVTKLCPAYEFSLSDHAHCATALVDVPADRAYAFLVDPAALGRWSLGCMDLVHVGSGIYRGRSLFDGGEGWLSIDGDPQRRVIDYHVGTMQERAAAHLRPRGAGAGVRPCAVRVLRLAACVALNVHGRGALAASLCQPRRRDLADQGPARSRRALNAQPTTASASISTA